MCCGMHVARGDAADGAACRQRRLRRGRFGRSRDTGRAAGSDCWGILRCRAGGPGGNWSSRWKRKHGSRWSCRCRFDGISAQYIRLQTRCGTGSAHVSAGTRAGPRYPTLPALPLAQRSGPYKVHKHGAGEHSVLCTCGTGNDGQRRGTTHREESFCPLFQAEHTSRSISSTSCRASRSGLSLATPSVLDDVEEALRTDQTLLRAC